MTDDEKIPSGEPSKDLVDNKKDKSEESVSYQTYLKTLEQEKNAKERAKTVEQELNELKASIAKKKEDELLEKGEVEKLLKLREEELQKERDQREKTLQENKELESTLVNNYKLDAIMQKLPGKLKHKDYKAFIDIDSVLVDPDTGNIDDGSLSKVVSEFVESHSSLIDSSNFKDLPGDAPVGKMRKYTQTEWKSLSLKDKKENWSRRPVS
jgi:hypothetical protein